MPSGLDDFEALDLPGARCLARAELVELLRQGFEPGTWTRDVAADAAVETATELRAPNGEASTLEVDIKVHRATRLDDGPATAEQLRALPEARHARRLLRAAAFDLPVREPLAIAWLEDAAGHRLVEVWRTGDFTHLPPAPWPPELAAKLGELLRRAHESGLHAPDLRPAHLRACPASAAPVLFDLSAARFGGAPQSDERAACLAALCADHDGLTEDPALRPLLMAYRPTDLQRRLAANRARRLRHRRVLRAGQAALRDAADLEARTCDDEVRAKIEAFSSRTDDARPTPRRSGRRGAVWVLDDLVVKRRSSAHARALWQAAAWLEHAGVPAPAAYALRTFPRREGSRSRHQDGEVFAERIPGDDLATELVNGALDRAALLEAASDLGQSVARLHAFGLRNRDLKLDNLVRDPRAGGRVVMVDLDGIRRRHALEPRGVGRDLGRLLAAWWSVRHPDEAAVVRSFHRSYHRASLCLQQTVNPRLRSRIEARAREWFAAHASRGSDCGDG